MHCRYCSILIFQRSYSPGWSIGIVEVVIGDEVVVEDEMEVEVVVGGGGDVRLSEFDVVIRDKKGAENLAADHLSRLENPHQSELEKKEITETFPLETLGMVTFRGDDNAPWFADFANY
ncbi:hypothetical protein Tco_0424402, partial [Tanacetum coccineum]